MPQWHTYVVFHLVLSPPSEFVKLKICDLGKWQWILMNAFL